MLARGSRKAARELQKWYVCFSLYAFRKLYCLARNTNHVLAILDQSDAIVVCLVHIASEAGQASLGL